MKYTVCYKLVLRNVVNEKYNKDVNLMTKIKSGSSSLFQLRFVVRMIQFGQKFVPF
uniref:Uncharacterized protein n=1 Tax=Physcomitrium patens TaxID=3218 RepID=A0A2K1L0W7_PHYPA|nr:hypothetical protein PHYPA_002471 [Physcomitrium patens]